MTWPMVALGEIFDIARGGSPRPINKFLTEDANGLNWVMISDATASGKVIQSTKKKIKLEGLKKTREVFPGDFILSNSMSFGRPYIMGIEGCIHDGWLLLRPDPDRVNQDYFYHLLGSQEVYTRFASRAAGATVKNLNSQIVREVEIPLPPLAEQKRIAGILDQADALRRLRHRAVERLNTLGQAIFHEMFGDLNSSIIKASLGDVINVRSSLADPKLPENASLPHVGPEHIDSGSGAISWMRVRSCREDGVTSGKYIFEAGDVIYSKIRPYLNKVAISDRVGMCSADMYSLVPMDDKITRDYLHFVLGGDHYLRHAERTSGRANIPKVNRKQLLSYEIPLPTIMMQEEFSRLIGLLSKPRLAASRHLTETETLFASLQQRAFRGEL